MCAEELTPQRSVCFALDGAHHDLSRLKSVEELHEQLVGLLWELAHDDGQHGGRAPNDLRAFIEGAHLGPHDLVPVAGVVETSDSTDE